MFLGAWYKFILGNCWVLDILSAFKSSDIEVMMTVMKKKIQIISAERIALNRISTTFTGNKR